MIEKIEKIIILCGVFLIIAKIILAGFLFLERFNNPIIEISQPYGGAQAEELINLTNQYRLNHGLNELIPNPRLTQAAINKAKDILEKNYFSHTSPDGRRFSYWIKESGYPYFYAGENLAIDFSNSQELFDAWIKSDKHRENIERREFQEIGIASLGGIFENRKTNIVVQLFGTRIPGKSEIYNNDNTYPITKKMTYDNEYINIKDVIYQSLFFLEKYIDIIIIIIAYLLILIKMIIFKK